MDDRVTKCFQDCAERDELKATIDRLRAALSWSIDNLEKLVTEDVGNGTFVRLNAARMELVGFGARLDEARTALSETGPRNAERSGDEEADTVTIPRVTIQPFIEEAKFAANRPDGPGNLTKENWQRLEEDAGREAMDVRPTWARG
jgi:hypothetical protein